MGKKLYMDADADLDLIKDMIIAVIGYGTQGTARALNMRDMGLKVIVGADKGHPDWERGQKDGFEVMTVQDAARKADILELQITDKIGRAHV